MRVIRKMRSEDIPHVSELLCDCYRWLAEKEGYTESQLRWLLTDRGSIPTVERESKTQFYLIAHQAESITGMVAIRANEITKLYVAPEHHREGIGEMLFIAAEQEIRTNGYHEMHLGATDTAIPFYQKMGMTLTGRVPYRVDIFPGRRVAIMTKYWQRNE
ncbi:GNAT family N-acetyltransferase [candidate division KSB1 bacterium]|nr:GNAT family N-acetyltransferase [candidate division KSB1 bacterium]